MASRLNPLLLSCIIYCASCASQQKTCMKCALSCDGAAELKNHLSVRVLVEQLSETVHEEICSVSSLFKGERCSVVMPDCSKWDADSSFMLRMYAYNNNESAFEPFYDRPDLKPDCDPEAMTDRSKPDGADGNLSNKLLILLAALLLLLLPP